MLCCITTAIEMLCVWRYVYTGAETVSCPMHIYHYLPSCFDSTRLARGSASIFKTMSVASSHCLNKRDTVPAEKEGGRDVGGDEGNALTYHHREFKSKQKTHLCI